MKKVCKECEHRGIRCKDCQHYTPKKRIVNHHHIVYPVPEHGQSEVVVRMTRGEHFLITRLNRYRHITPGFIKAIKYWLVLNEDRGEDI